MANFIIRPLERGDRNWVAHLLDKSWGSTRVVSRGVVHYAHTLPGFVIEPLVDMSRTTQELRQTPLVDAPVQDGDAAPPATPARMSATAEAASKVAGFITYNIVEKSCEIVTINSYRERIGVGSALIEAVKQAALSEGCKRLWLITTNDNLHALRFYQKRGFELVAVYRNALAEARKLKPEIPLTGMDDIPLRDEIELELPL